MLELIIWSVVIGGIYGAVLLVRDAGRRIRKFVKGDDER